MQMVDSGLKEFVLGSATLQICAACTVQNCLLECPYNNEPAKVIDTLRAIARAGPSRWKGAAPNKFLSKLLTFSLIMFGATAMLGVGYVIVRYATPPPAVTQVLEIPEESIRQEGVIFCYYKGATIAITFTGDGYGAFVASCPEADGGFLEFKRSSKELSCPAHKGRYDLNGQPLSGSCAMALRRVSLEIADGKVILK
jgi:nitrite reductase/ring-hydroxylating ferredoxin subunit